MLISTGFLPWLNSRFNYYNAPEGEDPIGKIIALGKIGFIGGTAIGIYDACLWSHCANAPQFLNTLGYWVVPLTGMCVAYSAVTYSLTNFRKKDDKFNVIAGAVSSGAVLHAWQRCPRTSGWGTVFMVLYAVLKKQQVEDGMSPNVFIPAGESHEYRKWLFPWRNLEYRNYTSKPMFPHDKTDYYVNHY